MIRNGDVELQAREEEIRFLKMQLQEEKRSHELLQKAVPNKRNLEQEIIMLQIQVTYCGQISLQLALNVCHYLSNNCKSLDICVCTVMEANIRNKLKYSAIPFQLSQCQDRMMELEKAIQNPEDANRVRFLEGKDPTPAALQTKLEEVLKISFVP